MAKVSSSIVISSVFISRSCVVTFSAGGAFELFQEMMLLWLLFGAWRVGSLGPLGTREFSVSWVKG